VAALSPDDLRRLLGLVCQDDQPAWAAFLDRYAPVLLQAVRSIERDRDDAADAFVFVCERLRERRGTRLSAFDFDRTGSFETWLRAVAMNLARDARRHRLGRFRPLAVIHRFPPLEQRVFRLRYELGFSFDHVFFSLQPEFPGLTEARLAEADAHVSRSVSAQQRWILLTRRPHVESLSEGGASEEDTTPLPPSEQLDPEEMLLRREAHERLSAWLATLTVEDRLLFRLRTERGVTLERLAAMFGFSNAQAVHRRLREIVARLRQLRDREV
jgi:RNA polymerase sigma factor (sigma-70 family)